MSVRRQWRNSHTNSILAEFRKVWEGDLSTLVAMNEAIGIMYVVPEDKKLATAIDHGFDAIPRGWFHTYTNYAREVIVRLILVTTHDPEPWTNIDGTRRSAHRRYPTHYLRPRIEFES